MQELQTKQTKVLNMHGDSTLSNLLESTSPAPVLRQHLKLAKTEESVLPHLQTGDAFLRPGTHSAFNDHANDDKVAFSPINRDGHQKLEIGNLKFSIASWDSKRAITLENVVSQPLHTHTGKLMACINTALPVLSHVHGTFILNTVVEEFNSNKLVRLELICSKQEAMKLSIALKNPYLYGMEPKSVIVVQNPVFKTESNGKFLSIRCEKLADIIFLGQIVHPILERHLRSQNEDRNESTNMSSSEESESDEEIKSGSSSQALFPTPFSSSDEQYAYEEWREWGNKHSLRRMHSQALAAYTIAQRFHPRNMEVLAAKTASLINLGLFSAALKELDIISSQDPFNTGFITRKSHCLWGLGRYEEANEYLKECLERLSSTEQGDSDEILKRGMFIQQIISRTEKIIQLKNDPTLLDNENFFKTQMRASYDDPEYYTPISLILDDHNVNDHRKIAVANQDITAGKILAITKAFTVVVHDHNEMESGSDELINLTIQKLQIERPFEADFYKSLEWSSEKIVKLPKNDVADFCKRYTYGSSDIAGVGTLQAQKQTRGIWTYPLNIKHACVGGNAVWYICGNLMFIRAISDIREGEKIIMAHIEPTKSFDVRTEFLNAKGIECSCTLCQFENREPEHTAVRRNLLLNETHFKGYIRNIVDSLTPAEIAKLKHRIEDLEMLRGSAYAKMNFPMVEPMYNFGLYLMEIQNFDEAIIAFEKAYFVIENTSAIFTLVKLSLLLSYCYIVKKKGSNRAKAKKWFQAMQSYTNLSFGSLQPLKNMFKTEFELLKRKGIAT